MKTTDNVSPELRKVEKEVDNYYKSNSLIKLPFATAACSFLAFAELEMLKQESNVSTSQELGTQVDNFVNELKAPMFWLFSACEQGGKSLLLAMMTFSKHLGTYSGWEKNIDLY